MAPFPKQLGPPRQTGGIWKRTYWGIKVRTFAIGLGVPVVLLAILVPTGLAARNSSSPAPVTVDWTEITGPRGGRLPDFSHCGYHASEEPLPLARGPAAVTVNPQSDGQDDTARIQRALNQTAMAGGGVVALGSGDFSLSPPGLTIPSGVVLRGAGVDRTRLTVSGLTNDPLVSLGNRSNPAPVQPLATAPIVDRYVPIGATKFRVDDGAAFRQGQTVFVQRAVTAKWIRANGMADLVRDGTPQTWLAPGAVVRQPRQIGAVEGNTISLTVPLVDALDADLMQPTIAAYVQPSISAEMGIESLSMAASPSCSGVGLDSSRCNGPAVALQAWAADSWVRDLDLRGFNAFVHVHANASRITVQHVTMNRDADIAGAALPGDVIVEGSQVLVADCAQVGSPSARSFAFLTESLDSGPNALLRHATTSASQIISPHQRWAQGLLVEDTAAVVLLVNRATNGTGHGWAINGGVGWNLRGSAVVESPPLGTNWCVGCSGLDGRSNGSLVDAGVSVTPTSLYDAQLQARMKKDRL